MPPKTSFPSPPPKQATTAIATVKLGALEIEVEDAPQDTLTYTSKPLYSKEARAQLSQEKKNELMERAMRCHLEKFTLVTEYDATDPEKLDGTYNLAMLIAHTRSHHLQYDMDNVFDVVLLDDDEKTPIKTLNLYTEYPSLTIEQVAKSNKWYATIPKTDKYPWFRENLLLTEKYMGNAIDPTLLSKCMEDYETYADANRGGPLLFAIMIGHLQSNTTSNVDYLRKLIADMRIDSIDGEDVGKVVSLLRSAIKRLTHVKDPVTGQNSLPPDLPLTVVKLLQTTSVDSFNQYFRLDQREGQAGVRRKDRCRSSSQC
jgi:hypothetical protein